MFSWRAIGLVCLMFSSTPVLCYYPVVIMHGILSSNEDMNDLVSLINTAHPGTKITNINGCNDGDSLINMWEQSEDIYQKMKPLITDKDPVILICYSQGGLICRSILEKYDHNVHTFISLSSPQAGQYGDTDYLRFLFPHYIRDTMYLFFYSEPGQDISVGNYWNDPYHQDEYFSSCNFLPSLNNGTKPEFKENFSKLSQLVLIGGPDDGVITPWQSSQFGFYKDKSRTEVVPYTSQYYYLQDTFGLKTLDKDGKIKTHTVSGVKHTHWHGNQTVFENCIKPYLK